MRLVQLLTECYRHLIDGNSVSGKDSMNTLKKVRLKLYDIEREMYRMLIKLVQNLQVLAVVSGLNVKPYDL